MGENSAHAFLRHVDATKFLNKEKIQINATWLLLYRVSSYAMSAPKSSCNREKFNKSTYIATEEGFKPHKLNYALVNMNIPSHLTS